MFRAYMKQTTVMLLTDSLPVIPALVVHVLSDQLNGGLGSIYFQSRHIQIIHKEHKPLAKRWTKHPFTTLVQLAINDVLLYM